MMREDTETNFKVRCNLEHKMCINISRAGTEHKDKQDR